MFTREDLMKAEIRIVHRDAQPMLLDVLSSVFDVIETRGERLTQQAIPILAHCMKIPRSELCSLLSVAQITSGQEDLERLGKKESDHLIKIVKAFNRCIEIFGDTERASHWLKSPYFAFRGATPLSLLDSSSGIEKILNELERIGHEAFIAGVVF